MEKLIKNMGKKSAYIEQITQNFLRYGIKSMSMDDIARELGMSKKTLYQHFKDKNDIVTTCVQHIKKRMKIIFEVAMRKKRGFVECEVERAYKMKETNNAVKPTFIFDLKKFYPSYYTELISFKNDLIYKTSAQNLRDGIAEGTIRSDINLDFVAKYMVTISNAIFNPDVTSFSEEDLVTYSEDLLKYGLYAVCTPLGIEEFNRLMEEKSKESK